MPFGQAQIYFRARVRGPTPNKQEQAVPHPFGGGTAQAVC